MKHYRRMVLLGSDWPAEVDVSREEWERTSPFVRRVVVDGEPRRGPELELVAADDPRILLQQFRKNSYVLDLSRKEED